MKIIARGRTRARTEAAENAKSLWKAVFLLLRSPSVSQLLRQKNREIETKGMRRPFLLIRRPCIAVTEAEEIEPKTVKKAECLSLVSLNVSEKPIWSPELGYFWHCHIVRFYTVLPSIEILNVVFKYISWHATRQTLSRSTDFKSSLLHLYTPL